MIKHLSLFLTNTVLFLLPNIAQAQTYTPSNRTPQADNSIGTVVNPTGTNNFNIDGGLQRGQNLFHSFTDFSIPTGGAANFSNPAGTQSIITRVTGNLFSDLNGRLNTNGANFLLINPNGVVFGTNAQLNVGKAFVTSTANGVDFVDAAGRNYNFGVNKAGDAPLISVDPNVTFNPVRLIMGGSIPGSKGIENYGILQTNNESQYIGLIGGNVTFNGGQIIAPGGRVDLGGLNSAGTVTTDPQGLVFGGNNLTRSDISLTNGALVTVRANQTLAPVNTFVNNASSPGSSINIQANNVRLIDDRSTSNPNQSSLDAGLEQNSGIKTVPTGDININALNNFIIDNANIKNTIRPNARGQIGDIKITANSLDINNESIISSVTAGIGDAGNININTIDNLSISGTNNQSLLQGDLTQGLSSIVSSTQGQGNAGKITLSSQGKLSITNRAGIIANVSQPGQGSSKGIEIKAKDFSLTNISRIQSSYFGTKGNAGDISIKTTGDLSVSGTNNQSLLQGNELDGLSGISSSSSGQGNTGKITLDVQGKLSVTNQSRIFSNIFSNQVVSNSPTIESKGIDIKAGSFDLTNISTIESSNSSGQGNAGNIKIEVTGDMTILGTDNRSLLKGDKLEALSGISSSTFGEGNTGKITIKTDGLLSIGNRAGIFSIVTTTGIGNSQGIDIKAGNLSLANIADIRSGTNGQGNAGNINIETTGDLSISGTDDRLLLQGDKLESLSAISSSTFGKGNAGKITIDSKGNSSLVNRAGIFSIIDKQAVGNSQGIDLKANNLDLNNLSLIQSANYGGTGDAGNIKIDTKGDTNIQARSQIASSTSGRGRAGNVSLSTDKLALNNSAIAAVADSVNGGNITLDLSDKLLLRNNSAISTTSGTAQGGGNGGNITVNSPLIVALPGNNDITANAYNGNGGKVNITSQGLFGIQYRPIGSDFTNDITASSTFGQSGAVNVNTPGADPGKDSTELPKVTTDASNQISQACSASNRQNKLTVTGRGGLPPTANEPLTSDVVWQDARAASSQPTANNTMTNPVKLAIPAVGWVFDGKGKVTLIAAVTQGQPTGTSIVCPNIK
jgi:filamentous hemagglutinin family protein